HDGRVSRFGRADGLSSDTIQNIFEDREGTIWIATTQGIDAFRDLRVASVTNREGLSADLANAVLAASDGTVWINAWHSLDAWRDGKMTSLNAGNGLPGEEVTAMFQERAGPLLIGIDRTLNVFEGGRFKPIYPTDGTPFGSLTGIAQDAEGDIWVVTHSPFMLTRIRERKVIERIPRSTIPFTQGMIAADPRDGIWLSLTNGNLGRYRRGQLDTFEIGSEPGTSASGLVAFPDGTIVASTARGLAGWREGKTQLMSEENGLPCREIYTLLTDAHDDLWLYASCGVIHIASDQLQRWWNAANTTLTLRLFDTLDGAQPARGNFFPRGSVGPDGRVWFANASVVQMIDPKQLGSNALPAPVQIERLVADRESFPLGGDARLPPNPRDLQIDYTGLSFVVPQKTRFRYRLIGHDVDWQEVGTRRQAFYTDLQPGNYVFEVTASNNDGVWNTNVASAAFSITPTLYQTRTFAALCVLSAAALVWLLIRMRVKQLEMRMRVRLEERIVERERIARELHDTLLQGLLSACLQLSVANSQLPQDAPAKSLFEKILRLLRQLSEDGRNAVTDLRGREPERDGLERALAQIPNDLGADDSVQFRLLVEGAARALRPAIRDEIYRIAREALANAFRHSGASIVETVLEYTPNAFRLVVRDDGRGMDADVLHSGRAGHWGLPGMRERSIAIGAQLKVLSAPGAGTEIKLSLPARTAFTTSSGGRWTDWLSRQFGDSETT
ncbi:MAG TPA: triple tyrosine motif-containing protein, partial [Steroidobacteraceae bacterium]|nr:triple tyrosine motif-containing protein [Steroidobacteraceae bacterium]